LKNTFFSQYIWLFLIAQSGGRKQLEEFAYGAGKPGLNLNNVRDVSISLPPLLEQKEIVRQVDKLFALADKLEAHYHRAMARVEKFPQAILAKAFRGELVPQDPNDEPAEKLLERIHQEREKLERVPGSPRKRQVRPKRTLEKAGSRS
jgi:type I restriction enzyme S subunit